MTSTRTAVSTKQLERQIGVGYKTAWVMLNLTRNELMDYEEHEPEKWLQSYLAEFTFRCNHRNDERAMFETLLMLSTTR
jgi:hypothetical protein